MKKLYTFKGDKGYTELANGRRIFKGSIMIELIGTLDEFSSVLGAAKVFLKNEELALDIEALQNMTFSVMAYLAGGKMLLADDTIKNVEEMTDKYCEGFCGFTIPGKTEASAFLDVARCVMRRAERIAVRGFYKKRITPFVMRWLNRTSDLVYAMGRFAAGE